MLDLLQSSAGPDVSATVEKIFYDHVAVESVLDRNFFENEAMNFLVICRRPIDCFISFQKAVALEKFILVDTTETKPRVSFRDFVHWHQQASRWFDTSISSLERNGRNHVVLEYGTDISGVDDMALIRRLRDTVRSFGIETHIPTRSSAFWAASRMLGGFINITNYEGGTLGLAPQDRSARTEEKIENWDEFTRELKRYDGDLRRLETYFVESDVPMKASASQ